MTSVNAGESRVASTTAIETAEQAATRIRKLQPQIVLLADFEFAPSVLAPQREAFPSSIAATWPVPAGNPEVSAYAEACVNEWFFGRNRIVDPARPYFLVAFRRAGIVAMEIARQTVALGKPPASVIQIGESPRSRPAGGIVGRALRAVRSLASDDVDDRLDPEQQSQIDAAAANKNRLVADWAASALAAWRPAHTLLPFPVFQLVADRDCERSEWIDNQRCQVRADGEAIGVTHAAEVNAFVMRVVLSSVRGLQLDPGAAERAASQKLDQLTDMLAREADRTL